MAYTWLLFDADGTLFDYDRAEADALRQTFVQLAGSFDSSYGVLYRQINHAIWVEFEQGNITAERLRSRRFELLLQELEMAIDAVQFSDRYLTNLAARSQLVDGAEAVVKSLHNRFGLMIITNGLSEVQRPRLARSAVAGYFQDLVISEEVGSAKPDGGIFEVAFQRMGWPAKAEVLIIGDSLTSDMQGGHDYGIDTCWFNPSGLTRETPLELTYEIANLRQLLDILQ